MEMERRIDRRLLSRDDIGGAMRRRAGIGNRQYHGIIEIMVHGSWFVGDDTG
jgi:hypothetical protein